MNDQRFPEINSALAVWPSVAGFGWMMCSGPLAPIDYAVSQVARKVSGARAKNENCIERLEEHIVHYHPTVLLLEDFQSEKSRRERRTRDLSLSMIALAAAYRIPARIISRKEIAGCFTSTKPETRYETALVVAEYFRQLGHRLPKPRQAWQSEKDNMALFNAAALAITHYMSQ